MVLQGGLKRAVLILMAGVSKVPGVRTAVQQSIRWFPRMTRVWARVPAVGVFRVKLDGRGFEYASTLHDGVGRAMYWQGFQGYEPETMRLLLAEAARGRVFIDVGANTGLFSIAAALTNPRLRVHAFEPSPVVFRYLGRNVRLNGLSSTIVCNRMAISDAVGVTKFHVPSANTASGSLNVDGFHALPGRVVELPVMTLDAYMENGRLEHVDLLKVDVEGFESLVLRGARKMLEKFRPTIFCECLPETDTRGLEDVLAQFGYRYYHLRKEGPRLRDRIEPDSSEEYKNYMFTLNFDDHTRQAKGAR